MILVRGSREFLKVNRVQVTGVADSKLLKN